MGALDNLYLMCMAANDPPVPAATTAGIAAAAASIPGIGAQIYLQHIDLVSGNYAPLANALAMFSYQPRMRISVIGGVCVPTSAYRTITLPISLYGGPPVTRCLPVIWDAGYIAEYRQAFVNLQAYLSAQGLMPYLTGLEFSPISRSPYDGESCIPSTNNAPYYADYSAAWIGGTDTMGTTWPGVGYTEAVYCSALATHAGNVAAVFPGVPLTFAMQTAYDQKLGFAVDPTYEFSNAQWAAMEAVCPLITSIQQSLTASTPQANYQLALGKSLGRFGCQIAANSNTVTQATSAAAYAISLNAQFIEVNYAKAAIVANYLNTLSTSPFVSFGRQVVSFGGQLLSFVIPPATPPLMSLSDYAKTLFFYQRPGTGVPYFNGRALFITPGPASNKLDLYAVYLAACPASQPTTPGTVWIDNGWVSITPGTASSSDAIASAFATLPTTQPAKPSLLWTDGAWSLSPNPF